MIKRFMQLPYSCMSSQLLIDAPFHAVATDIGSGQPVVLGSGNLAQALRASMSIPLPWHLWRSRVSYSSWISVRRC